MIGFYGPGSNVDILIPSHLTTRESEKYSLLSHSGQTQDTSLVNRKLLHEISTDP
jgi:hypothetical protein